MGKIAFIQCRTLNVKRQQKIRRGRRGGDACGLCSWYPMDL